MLWHFIWLAALVLTRPVWAQTQGREYHVRVDGGSAQQCDGRVDAPFSGVGLDQSCAWSNPLIALPPHNLKPRIAGGDTLIIHSGEYMIGLGAPGAERCSANEPWACGLGAPPAGVNAQQPTRILGNGAEQECSQAPQLWGTQRVGSILTLSNTSYVLVSCLEITDHSSCVEGHADPKLRCERRSFPYGEWAKLGIYAEDAANIELRDLNIHGLAAGGVMAGRLRDWTVTRVRIAANGWVGWDGDIGKNKSSNSGTLKFSRWLVEWNGCAETYPEKQPTGCWAQSAGGYGDGVGTAKTGGDWMIEDSIFRFNTSDGLDLLYNDGSGKIILNRVWAEGNAGNQIKAVGEVNITNSVVIGTCGFFDSKPFSYKVDNCRAEGDAVATGPLRADQTVRMINNTIVSEGNVVISGGGPTGSTIELINNILVGLPSFMHHGRRSADTYLESGERKVAFKESHSIKQNLHSANCESPFVICGDAGLVSIDRKAVNPRLLPSSKSIDSGLKKDGTTPVVDYLERIRPQGRGMDRGAFEER